jgi:hypothetical protein
MEGAPLADDDPLMLGLAEGVEDESVPEAPYEAGDHDALPWIPVLDPQLVEPDRGDPATRGEEPA